MGVLRLLLALTVVIGHVAPILGVRLMHSSVAVQAFYLASGFYPR